MWRAFGMSTARVAIVSRSPKLQREHWRCDSYLVQRLFGGTHICKELQSRENEGQAEVVIFCEARLFPKETVTRLPKLPAPPNN